MERARAAAFAAGDFSTASQSARQYQTPDPRSQNHKAGQAWTSGDLSKNLGQAQSIASISVPDNKGMAPKSDGSIKR